VAGAVATLPLLVTAAGKAHVATLMASATPRALFPFDLSLAWWFSNAALTLAWSTASSGMFASSEGRVRPQKDRLLLSMFLYLLAVASFNALVSRN
jgi:hypothetical protein